MKTVKKGVNKKLWLIVAVLVAVLAALLAGAIAIGSPDKGALSEELTDAVLHEEKKFSLFGLIEVNPALMSAYSESPFFDYYADDLRPFFERRWEFLYDFNEAIRAVGVERGYACILNTDGNTCPFINPAMGDDVTNYVKEKLQLPISTTPEQ